MNYAILSLIDMAPQQYDLYLWRIYRNLGTISTAIGDYGEAVSYLQKSIVRFGEDKKSDPLHRASLHQCLADAYKGKQQLDNAETHYLLAWEVLKRQQASISGKAYLTTDLGLLYNSQQKFAQAVPYLRQSVEYWDQLNVPLPQADALADLAESYLGLGQYADAIATAQDALTKNQKVHAPTLTAYSVLVRAYGYQQEWKNAFDYQQRYNAKKQEQQQSVNQSESLRIKARFERERLQTAYRQERLLQNQRYQTLAKQADVDRLNGVFRTNELLRVAQTSDLKHQLETQQLRTMATQKQATIQQLNIDRLRLGLSAQKDVQNLLFAGIAIISLLGLWLLYYSIRLGRTNASLRTKNREIETALIRGQTIERKRVAVELHDRVSSLLGATKMTFQTIDVAVLSPRNVYESSLDLLNDVVTQVRQVSHNALPEQILQQDLTVSLKSLVRKLNRVERTVFSLTHEPGGTLPLTQEDTFNLYVMCLELCTNVLRHARANHAWIRLVWQDGWLAIQIDDDGTGANHPSEAGIGLQSIRERAAVIGAQFWLETGGQHGIKARIMLPLVSASAPG